MSELQLRLIEKEREREREREKGKPLTFRVWEIGQRFSSFFSFVFLIWLGNGMELSAAVRIRTAQTNFCGSITKDLR